MPSTTTTCSGTIEDRTPLLEDGSKPRLRQGQATTTSCIANLANTIIGTGALAMAHAFSGEGLIPGIIMVLFCATTSYLGLYFLTRSARLAPGHRQASFSTLSQITYPNLQRLFDFCVCLKCFGVSISYLIVIGGLMPKVIQSFQITSLNLSESVSVWLDRRVWILISMTLLCPLAFLRKLDSLKFTSYIALCAIAYLVFIVIFYTFFNQNQLPSSPSPGHHQVEIELFKFGPSFIKSLPVQIFAFTCAQNIFAVFNELKENSQKRLNFVIGTSIFSAATIYEVLGILGYLTFGSKVGGNLIEMYPHDSLAVSICQSGIVILVLFSYPLQLHPCRTSLDKFLFPSNNPPPPPPPLESSVSTDSDTDIEGSSSSTLLQQQEQEQEEQSRESEEQVVETETETEIPLGRFIIESSFILFSTFLIAMFVTSLETVLGFVGATGSTTISFILPSIFFLSLFKDSRDSKDFKLRILAWGLLIWGFLVMGISLSMNIYHLISKPEQDSINSLHTLGLLGGGKPHSASTTNLVGTN